MATATSDPVRLPPRPRIPKLIQTAAFLTSSHAMFAGLARRYGSAVVRVNLPHNNDAVVVCDPVLAKDLLSTGSDLVERAPSGAGAIGAVFGPGSTFSLAGDAHRERRKLLTPPFRGTRMRGYERIIEDEVRREIGNWQQGREFATIEPMLRITLGAILRAVFGAGGPALEELREMVPPLITLGSMLAACPPMVQQDLGPWSPWGRFVRERRRFDAIIASLIAEARADSALEQRTDVLALLLQARYDNGEGISDEHVADELLTLLGSGHETTAASLAWTLERLSRHPALLAELTEEADAGGSELRQATIWEVQRTRPVLDGTTRRTKTRIRLGEWVLPAGTNIIVSIKLAHESENDFADAQSFNPHRFLGGAPKPAAWIPFGGGVNRCVGAAFANMELDVVLRMLLREFRFVTTDAPGEKARWRGVATVPSRGGRAMVYRRGASAPTSVGTLTAAGLR
ncbi:cytochrome P450 [Candidatus Mycobacterium wuenschmannii]|uniref:Cytochrome P450 n=1 Tax=Candidatus Mycobacterium wuenschmannii TaxID=3027808 RepID=A0ABY8VZE4_9MYCO|nr:cytochrome P450 [Candidatus Mycobacterium wuenschmannii]